VGTVRLYRLSGSTKAQSIV